MDGDLSNLSTSKPEALWKIGDILWEDIKSDRKYTLPLSTKRVITRWMRERDQVNMDGGNMRARENVMKLMKVLDLDNPLHDKRFRAKVKEKVLGYIRNVGVKFRGVQYQEDVITKKRVWAPWTAKWLDDDWDGDTRPPQKDPSDGMVDSVMASVAEVLRLPEEHVAQFVTRFFDAADKSGSQQIRRLALERYSITHEQSSLNQEDQLPSSNSGQPLLTDKQSTTESECHLRSPSPSPLRPPHIASPSPLNAKPSSPPRPCKQQTDVHNNIGNAPGEIESRDWNRNRKRYLENVEDDEIGDCVEVKPDSDENTSENTVEDIVDVARDFGSTRFQSINKRDKWERRSKRKRGR
jgi:hypothetical protein